MITQARVREAFNYNTDTGVFTWRVSPAGHTKVGVVAGSKNHEGYWCLTLSGQRLLAHRVAWLYVHGWVPDIIDHINRVKLDNRIANLRPINPVDSTHNRDIKKPGKSGFVGVRANADGTFDALIKLHNKQIYLGRFTSAETASSTYREAKKLLHPCAPVMR